MTKTIAKAEFDISRWDQRHGLPEMRGLISQGNRISYTTNKQRLSDSHYFQSCILIFPGTLPKVSAMGPGLVVLQYYRAAKKKWQGGCNLSAYILREVPLQKLLYVSGLMGVFLRDH